MVLRTLETQGAMQGYGIARRIEQVSGDRPHFEIHVADNLGRGMSESQALREANRCVRVPP